MLDKIELEKLKKEYPDFFEKTPANLIEFIFSEKTSKQITDICERNGVRDEEKIKEITSRVIWILLGKLPRKNLSITLEQVVNLTPETAKKITEEISQSILSGAPSFGTEEIVYSEEEIKEEIPQEPKKPPGKDAYHEPVE